ncbi:hypothetical protein [Leucobacter soli]|uniref:hypothetical protein n=1 Tax=Leucobacter soli TaxID=2812850 RepID=UPI00360EA96F
MTVKSQRPSSFVVVVWASPFPLSESSTSAAGSPELSLIVPWMQAVAASGAHGSAA